MSLADARDRAREADRLRGQGSDPAQERKREVRTQRQRPTVAALLSAFRRGRREPRWGFKKDLVDRDVSAKLDRPAEAYRLPTEERTLNDEEVRRLWLGVEPLGREMSTFIRLLSSPGHAAARRR